jgi:Peroxidase
MKANHLLLAALAGLLQSASGYPAGGWAALLRGIQQKAADPNTGPSDSSEMIGDLISPGAITPIGKAVKDIITGNADGQSTDVNYATPGALGTPACQQDACCVWSYVTTDMVQAFKGDSGRCTALARGAVRLGFHDAGAWNKTMNYGGADGSLILTDEVTHEANRGLEEIVNSMRDWCVCPSYYS